MTCSKCGITNDPGTTYCITCGCKLEETVEAIQPEVLDYRQTYQPAYQQPVPGKGMAITSLIMGIVGLVIIFFGLPAGITGLILGIISKKKLNNADAPTGLALGGIITSIAAILFGGIFTIAMMVAIILPIMMNYA
ncbi:MAG: hypothetical protein FWD34_09605 [Oscillospiraceae bacterium]|nr:hypothetical protein [Oscillospiraceae bacterium]